MGTSSGYPERKKARRSSPGKELLSKWLRPKRRRPKKRR
jgi:hypothetical protein